MIESVREANKMSAAVQNQKVEKTSIVTEDRIELEFSQQGIHDNTKDLQDSANKKKSKIVLELVNPTDLFSSESDDRSSTESELDDGDDLQEGLHALNQITNDTRKVIEIINNSSCHGHQTKRIIAPQDQHNPVPDPKRRKTDSKSDENLNQICQNVTKFSKKELEELVKRNIAEVLSARSEISDLRRRCDLYAEENEKWKKKQILLQKMCTDLSTVMKKFILDKQENQKEVKPVKITRHVGLQVSNRRKSTLMKPLNESSKKTGTDKPLDLNSSSSEKSVQSEPLLKLSKQPPPVEFLRTLVHPVPLPEPPKSKEDQDPNLKSLPPKPILHIKINQSDITLFWKMNYKADQFEAIKLYEVYGYQEKKNLSDMQRKRPSMLWKKVGDVRAKPIDSSNVGMACSLNQFTLGNKYHFAVRAKDVHNRLGHFSDPYSI